jgi:hypothetical protein
MQLKEAIVVDLHFTIHAEARVRQRGIREADVPVIVATGTPFDDDSVFLMARDVDREIQKLKREICALERLRGCRVVIEGKKVVTIYRPSKKTEKKLLRGQHRHHRAESNYQSTHSIHRRYLK